MSEKKQLTLAQGYFDRNQLLKILQRTPEKFIKQRPGKGGVTWNYVKGGYVKKALNYITGWMWNFTIVDKFESHGQIIVQGRLTILNKKGREIIHKDQFGRSEIKYLKGTQDALDIGNDYKSASTDALKKCASELGIASDVYDKEEFKEVEAQIIIVSEDEPVTEQQINVLKALKIPFDGKITKKEAALLIKNYKEAK